jgi:hypothetical protein
MMGVMHRVRTDVSLSCPSAQVEHSVTMLYRAFHSTLNQQLYTLLRLFFRYSLKARLCNRLAGCDRGHSEQLECEGICAHAPCRSARAQVNKVLICFPCAVGCAQAAHGLSGQGW